MTIERPSMGTGKVTGQPSSHQEDASGTAPFLGPEHLAQLKASAIDSEVIKERGYRSMTGKTGRQELESLGFAHYQQRDGILIPLHGVDGKPAGYVLRPDSPRHGSEARAMKYELASGSMNILDCPPRCQPLLGDPRHDLFITEGVKKADALASLGVCTVSINGVWGWRGTNRAGGKAALPDWEYIALNERSVYITFDSDAASNPQVKDALHRLAAYLARKGAKVQWIRLPQDGPRKVGVDDYLAERHTLADLIALSEPVPVNGTSKEERVTTVPGFVLEDGTIGEVVENRSGLYLFKVCSSGQLHTVSEWPAPGGGTYVPASGALVGKVVHFASAAAPYGKFRDLYLDIRGFIARYVDLPELFYDVSTLYVMLSWLFDVLPVLPYLRFLGQPFSGKSRALRVVGMICFRPMFAGGATTASPIFRIIDAFRGTLVVDEGDPRDSDMWSDIIKILNEGYHPGFPVLRTEGGHGDWHVTAYEVFGPKLIGTRQRFRDEALESRCLTCPMLPTARDDIPRVLPRSFDEEAKALRDKLLGFRFANLIRLKGVEFTNKLAIEGLVPRLQEVLMPFMALSTGDQQLQDTLRAFARQHQESLLTSKHESPTGLLLQAIVELLEERLRRGEELKLTAKELCDQANKHAEAGQELTVQKTGTVLKALELQGTQDPYTRRRLLKLDMERIIRLGAAHGVDVATLKLLLTSASPSGPSTASSPAISTATKESPEGDGPSQHPSAATSDTGATITPKDSKKSKDFLGYEASDVHDSALSPPPGLISLQQTIHARLQDAGPYGFAWQDLVRIFDQQGVDRSDMVRAVRELMDSDVVEMKKGRYRLRVQPDSDAGDDL